jgi:hypothetical protein
LGDLPRHDAPLEGMGLGEFPGQLLAPGRLAAEAEVSGDHVPAAFDLSRLASADAMTRVASEGPTAAPPSDLPSSAQPSAQPLDKPSDQPSAQPSDQPSAPPRLAEEIRLYRKREGTEVLAIQLNLDMDAFTYRKWGGLQTCKSGDWIVDRNGSVHTVSAESFARTYKKVGPATYVKQGQVWAAAASCDGAIATKEGVTHYKQGDVLVWNDKELKDGYAIAKDVFASLYELVPPSA